MKRPIATITALLVTFYMVWCLSAFWTKPPSDFAGLPDETDRQSISEWYRSTSGIPRQSWSLESLRHAMTHPLAPHRFRPCVTENGLGGEGSVMVSYGGYIGIFARTGAGGSLEFNRLDSLH
jgi:hypothetical protein